jgi:hypothetical protein
VERGLSGLGGGARPDRQAPQPYLFNLYLEPLRRFQLAAEGHGDRQPPDHLRARIRQTLDPLPLWYPPFEETRSRPPTSRCTRSPSGRWPMYHSWGTRRTPGCARSTGMNPLYVPRPSGEHGFAEGDWAWLTSPHGRIKVPVARMDALNPHTVWTWNAIGKRRGAWALDRGRARGRAGVPAQPPDPRASAAQRRRAALVEFGPVTGQAAWYDLRVRIEKAPEGGPTAPNSRRAALARGAGAGDARPPDRTLSDDQPSRPDPSKARPGDRPRHLRRLPCLRHLLQGAGTPRITARRSPTATPMARSPKAPSSTASTASRSRRTKARRSSSISRNPACIARTRPASPSAPPAPATSAPRTGSCW